MAHVRRVLYYTAKCSRTNQVNYLRTLFSIKTTTITKHWYFESFEPFNWTIQFTVSVNDSTQGNVFVWTAYENSLKDVWFQWMVLESKNYFTNTSDHIGTVFESCGTKKEWWRFDAIPEFYYNMNFSFFRHSARRKRAFWTFLCINFSHTFFIYKYLRFESYYLS